MGDMAGIGQLALRNVEAAMGSSTPCESYPTLQLVTKPALVAPTTDDEAAALRQWAEAEPDKPEPATVDQLSRHLAFMAATLPSKNVDDQTGRMRTAVYARILGSYSNDALAYMARTACMALDWFPTPRQCLEILKDYTPPISDRDRALMLCSAYSQARFNDWIARLERGEVDQSEVDTIHERWRMMAWERGLLRLDGDRLVRRETKELAA